jgi:DNA-binding CsgD family transcriptional regulator/tetratricopeptide (TPR) repeat protein
MQLVGRDADLATLHGLAEGIAGQGRAVEVRGDPGVGKTALVAELERRLAGARWRVLRAEGVPTEQQLPLAGLHELLRPVLGRAADLREPQRHALETAFGLRVGDVDFFRVALAALDLLSRVATDAPVAVLVDDAHWLDRASAEVLAFVARRIAPEPVLLAVSTRPFPDDPFEEAGLPVLDLGPLDEDSARTLLDRVAPQLAPALREHVLGAAAGNPLALLELPRTPQRIPTARTGSEPVTLSARLEKAFAARVGDLPARTQDLLLLCAVNDSPRLSEALAAAEGLTGSRSDVADLDPALNAGLARVEGQQVGFRHPLVRSALVQSCSPGRRQAAHAALAVVVRADPDRYAWHRAECALGPDEGIAGELEAAAHRAHRRGSALGAVAALERSAQLSATPTTSVRRLLRAAEIACETGRGDLTRRLLDRIGPVVGSTPHRLRYAAVEESCDERMQGGAARVLACVALADEARDGRDVDLALRFLMRAAARCWHLDLGPAVEQQVLAALDRLPVGATDPRGLVTRAYTSPFTHGPGIARALAGWPIRHDDDPGDLLLLGYAAACVGASREADTICARAADGLREHGRLALLAEALSLQAWAALRRGRLDVVEEVARECAEVAADTGQPIPRAAALAALAAVAGIRGDEAAATDLADRAERLAVAGRNTIGLAVTQVARGLIAATAGRPDEAFEHLEQLCSRAGRAHQRMQACWALGSFAEAAAQAGHPAVARAELDRWQAVASADAPPGVDLALRHARAVLAAPEEADDAFRAALAADWGDRPFEHGRLLLAYGRWLRREHQVSGSRTQLRAARDAFVRADARPWADRARRELRAAGEGGRSSPAGALDRLSPQERQIARLVADGLGNREIGQRLYLSHRTVGSHLYRMFPKLGVSSRAQLARLVSGPPGHGPDVGTASDRP